MTPGNAFAYQETGTDAADPELFSARLTPHRSLGRTGFLVLMAVVCAISFIGGIASVMMGAWPVLGFFGLDALAIYWAFRVNFRRANAYEDVTITLTELRLRRVSHKGHVMEWRFNPLWVRLDQETHEEFGIERLYIVARGQRVSIASFLGPEEKASFAKALTAGLQAAKRGPVLNPL
ncbi:MULTISPECIES: DUF2244 domain-containing protein [unclassified Bradyrhizobium]|uniref:DUF2244 domain-containing protein n=1 Tax=unclassified Bradyrhizobium TaxID=2631580 RepID=UPI0028ECF960|nr:MULTISPECIES: DUF2244 domain-containing protein [unclassified Bradyrhizobium]